MKKRVTLLVLIISAFTNGYSQTAYRSIASGNWKDWYTATPTWERTGNVYNPTPTWSAATGFPTSNQMVIIQSGHTVLIDSATRSCLQLIVQAGGKLWENGATLTFRVGVPSSGNSGTVDTLTVDGTLGGPGELFPLEMGAGAASLWIRGTGSTIELGRIRPQNGNSNYPGSAVANAKTGARLLIDKDMILNVANNYALSAAPSTIAATDSISVTILPGRTVTISNAGSYIHNDGSSGAGGNYVYNINGTLDLSANPSTSGGTKLMPFTNATSSVTLNVSGLLKLGGYFKADTITGNLGTVSLNINNGGLVDASLTSKLTAGSTGSGVYFKVSGTGALKRTVLNDGTRIEFPVGTTRATPVYFNGVAGPAETFTVTVKDALTNPAPSAATMAKEWSITEGTPGGNTDTLRFEWTTADQTNGFSGASPVYICRWNGTLWEYTAALVTGTGDPATPYVARGVGFSSFGLFVLTNSFPVPVSFINVKAYQKQTGVQVEFGNATESDIANYIIERSADGVNFTTINTVSAKGNNGSLNSYSYYDASPNKGNNFYRIKATERNGHVKYSSTLNINLRSTGIWVNAYPNPVKGSNVNVQLENFEKAVYTITIFNQVGQRVYAKNINHNGGTATFTVDLPASVKKGVYSLQVSNNATTVNNKIVVE